MNNDKVSLLDLQEEINKIKFEIADRILNIVNTQSINYLYIIYRTLNKLTYKLDHYECIVHKSEIDFIGFHLKAINMLTGDEVNISCEDCTEIIGFNSYNDAKLYKELNNK